MPRTDIEVIDMNDVRPRLVEHYGSEEKADIYLAGYNRARGELEQLREQNRKLRRALNDAI